MELGSQGLALEARPLLSLRLRTSRKGRGRRQNDPAAFCGGGWRSWGTAHLGVLLCPGLCQGWLSPRAATLHLPSPGAGGLGWRALQPCSWQGRGLWRLSQVSSFPSVRAQPEADPLRSSADCGSFLAPGSPWGYVWLPEVQRLGAGQMLLQGSSQRIRAGPQGGVCQRPPGNCAH